MLQPCWDQTLAISKLAPCTTLASLEPPIAQYQKLALNWPLGVKSMAATDPWTVLLSLIWIQFGHIKSNFWCLSKLFQCSSKYFAFVMWQTKTGSDQRKSKLWCGCHAHGHISFVTSGCDIFRLKGGSWRPTCATIFASLEEVCLSRGGPGPRVLGHRAHVIYISNHLDPSRTPKHRGMIYFFLFFWNTILNLQPPWDNLTAPSGIKNDWKLLSPASGFVSIFSLTGASSARTWSRASHSQVWRGYQKRTLKHCEKQMHSMHLASCLSILPIVLPRDSLFSARSMLRTSSTWTKTVDCMDCMLP